MDADFLIGLLVCGVYAAIYIGIPTLTYVLYRRYGPQRYRPQNRRTQSAVVDGATAANIHLGDAQTAPPLLLDPDSIDDWETEVVKLFRDGNELSAIELVQVKTGVSLEDAKVKVLKLDETAE